MIVLNPTANWAREKCIEALKPHSTLERLDFWVFCHLFKVWQLYHSVQRLTSEKGKHKK